jgi:hypothetical protein
MGTGTTVRTLGALLLLAGSARAEVIQVRIEKIAFAPQQISAHALPPDSTKRVALKAVGTVDYYCKFHPNMTGQILIKE